MRIIQIIGPETGRHYSAIDTGERWNGNAVVAFPERSLWPLIDHGDGTDTNGYGLSFHRGHVVDFTDADAFTVVPTRDLTLNGVTTRVYLPEGRAWDVLDEGEGGDSTT